MHASSIGALAAIQTRDLLRENNRLLKKALKNQQQLQQQTQLTVNKAAADCNTVDDIVRMFGFKRSSDCIWCTLCVEHADLLPGRRLVDGKYATVGLLDEVGQPQPAWRIKQLVQKHLDSQNHHKVMVYASASITQKRTTHKIGMRVGRTMYNCIKEGASYLSFRRWLYMQVPFVFLMPLRTITFLCADGRWLRHGHT